MYSDCYSKQKIRIETSSGLGDFTREEFFEALVQESSMSDEVQITLSTAYNLNDGSQEKPAAWLDDNPISKLNNIFLIFGLHYSVLLIKLQSIY